MKSIALGVALVYIFKYSNATAWDLCGPSKSAEAPIIISEVTVSPDPISAGAQVLFQLAANQSQGIEVYSGTLHASVKYLGFRVFKKSGELCEALQCPLLPGLSILNFAESMPAILPPGKMVLTLEAVRNDSLPLFCVDIDLDSKEKKDRRGVLNFFGLSVKSVNKI